VSLSTRNIAQNLQQNVKSATIDREAIYGWMRASCISLQPRVRIEATILDATNAPSRIALASVFASKNHIDVTARITIDKT